MRPEKHGGYLPGLEDHEDKNRTEGLEPIFVPLGISNLWRLVLVHTLKISYRGIYIWKKKKKKEEKKKLPDIHMEVLYNTVHTRELCMYAAIRVLSPPG